MAWYMTVGMAAYIDTLLLTFLICCPFLDAAVPEQVRISFGDTPQEVVIMWACEEKLPAKVAYGTDIRLKEKEEATATVVDLIETNANGLQFLYRAKLQNLHPGTVYYKVIIDDFPNAVKFFQVPPDGTNWSPQFLVLGDMGLSTELSKTLVHVSQDDANYTAVMFTGNHKTPFSGNEGKTGDDIFESLQTALSGLPYLTTTGHADIQDNTFVQFRHRISYPGQQWPLSLESMWYSIDIGPAHIISYSTDVSQLDQQVVDHQHNWLITDLTKANQDRVNKPWIIAIGNRPMYCSNISAPNDECALKESERRNSFEDIFFQHGVDLIINGASDAYERMWPLYKGTLHADNYTDPTAPVYLRVGTGMMEETVSVKPDVEVKVNVTENETDKKQTMTREDTEENGKELLNTNDTNPEESDQQESWSAFRLSDSEVPGYGRLKIVNSTHLLWDFLSTKDNAILDTVWITTKTHGQFVTVSPDEESVPVEIVTTAMTVDHTDNDTYDNNTSEQHNNFFQMLKEKLQTRNGLIIAISSGVGLIVFISCVCCLIIRRRRRKRGAGRRWERLDYEKSYYSDYSDVSTHADDGFEETELTADGNMPTAKLLSRTAV